MMLWQRIAWLVLFALVPPVAAEPGRAVPAIAIIIDDLGDRLAAGERALNLRGPLTYSILPRTPHAARLARLAHARGKEVMLHLPMQAERGNRLGPGGLTLDMDRAAFSRTVMANLESVPHAAGVNNHMGSLLTRHAVPMTWLMEELKQRGRLYFVDSRTTPGTIAGREAESQGVPTLTRDIFLDAIQTRAFVTRQFDRLIEQARLNGWAVGIGHPYPETLEVLEEVLPRLRERGVELVPVSTLIAFREKQRIKQWQASLSPSPKAAKSSKPSP